MPWQDCSILLEDLAEHVMQEQRDAENLAMLVDRYDYWLLFDYINAVTDPNDPQNQRERAERKRKRIKPPPIPALRAVALRRPDVEAQVTEMYARIQEQASRPRGGDGKPKSKFDLIEGS